VKTGTRAPGQATADAPRATRRSTSGRIPITLVAEGPVAPGPDEIVSLGVPFAPGVLRSTERVRVLDPAGVEVPAHVAVLATWSGDGSLRSVLVAFRATVPAGAPLRWTIDYRSAPGKAHVFGAAYHLSHDQAWLDFGDRIARHGIARMHAGAPKQWDQAMRSFSKYLGYRARGRTP
jgi:hypothetical protein